MMDTVPGNSPCLSGQVLSSVHPHPPGMFSLSQHWCSFSEMISFAPQVTSAAILWPGFPSHLVPVSRSSGIFWGMQTLHWGPFITSLVISVLRHLPGSPAADSVYVLPKKNFLIEQFLHILGGGERTALKKNK